MRRAWFARTLVFCGNSFTLGLDAASEAEGYRLLTVEALRDAYPGEFITELRSTAGSGGAALQMYNELLGWRAEHPDCVILQCGENDGPFPLRQTDEAGAGAYAHVTADAGGRIIQLELISEGAGYREGDYVAINQGGNTRAVAVVCVNSEGGVQTAQVVSSWAGTKYATGSAALESVSFERAFRNCLNCLMDWGSVQKTMVFVLTCYDGFNGSGSSSDQRRRLQIAVCSEPQYRDRCVVVDSGPTALEPGNRGVSRSASVQQGSRLWDIGQIPLYGDASWSPVGRNLYLTDGAWKSLITDYGYDTSWKVQTADSAPQARSGVSVVISHDAGWVSPGRSGDTAHPTNSGHSRISGMLSQAISKRIGEQRPVERLDASGRTTAERATRG